MGEIWQNGEKYSSANFFGFQEDEEEEEQQKLYCRVDVLGVPQILEFFAESLRLLKNRNATRKMSQEFFVAVKPLLVSLWSTAALAQSENGFTKF